jgi:hypothetical protein
MGLAKSGSASPSQDDFARISRLKRS